MTEPVDKSDDQLLEAEWMQTEIALLHAALEIAVQRIEALCRQLVPDHRPVEAASTTEPVEPFVEAWTAEEQRVESYNSAVPCAPRDRLVNRLQNIIEDECPVWEEQFDAGPGVVCSTSDAAVVIARWLSGTMSVRLDGLADKIAVAIHKSWCVNKCSFPTHERGDFDAAEAVVALLQSLAVQ
jgi:hypothetical protein